MRFPKTQRDVFKSLAVCNQKYKKINFTLIEEKKCIHI